MIEWMAQAAPLREASTVKKMNDRSLLLSLNKLTHYFRKWTTGSELNEFTINVLKLEEDAKKCLKQK